MVQPDSRLRAPTGRLCDRLAGNADGLGFDVVTRDEYYRNTHLQTIAFEIAREVVRQLVEAAHPRAERLRSTGRATLLELVDPGAC